MLYIIIKKYAYILVSLLHDPGTIYVYDAKHDAMRMTPEQTGERHGQL